MTPLCCFAVAENQISRMADDALTKIAEHAQRFESCASEGLP